MLTIYLLLKSSFTAKTLGKPRRRAAKTSVPAIFRSFVCPGGMREFWRFVGVFWGVFSLCEASGSQSFLFRCAFHSADAIMIAHALGRAFYTQLPCLSPSRGYPYL